MKPFFFISVLFAGSSAYAQCFPAGLTLTTNQEVADFAANNPGCTIIEGDLNIGDGVTSLAGLFMITEVQGLINFNVETSPITSLEGLNALTSVGSFNLPWALTDLNGLSSLNHIGGIYVYDQQMAIQGFESYTNQIITADGIVFQNSSSSPDFNGFANLEHVSQIEINEGSEHIDGFDNLQSIGYIDILSSTLQTMPDFDSLTSLGDFNYMPQGSGQLLHLPSLGNTTVADQITIRNTDILIDMSGFESLQTVNELILQSNFAMTSLIGLDNLQAVENLHLFDLQSLSDISNLSNLVFANNVLFDIVPLLSSLAGFEQVEQINTLYLASNYALNDISALDGVSALELVTMLDNPQLEACSVPWLCDYISNHPGAVELTSNGNGCNSEQEILLGCGNELSSLEGTIYYDADCDAIMNNADFIIPNAILFNDNGYPIAASNSLGFVSAPLLLNTSNTLNTGWIDGTQTTYVTLNTNMTPTVYTQDIGICPTPVIHDLRVLITPENNPRPGFSAYYSIHAMNLGNTPENVILTFDNFSMPGYEINDPVDTDGEVTWTLTLDPLQTETFEVIGIVASNVSIGTEYTPHATIDFEDELIVDEFFINNSHAIKQTVLGSFDPNDKEVFPKVINYADVMIGDTQILDYVVRFQNTGNFPAEFVRVTDAINTSLLDISTLQMVAASHSYSMDFEENEVEWFFDNIQLADSASNEQESHGYIHFRIRTRENLALNDIITNQVAIYFDFNVPVITNIAQTIFYQCPASVEITQPTVACAETQFEIFATESGLHSYLWQVNSVNMGIGETLILGNISTGFYDIQLLSDYYECSYDSELELYVDPQPFVTLSGDVIFCEEGTISSIPNGVMYWSLNGEILSSSASIPVYESGTYIATVTNVCGSYADSLEVIIIDIPESIELLIGDVALNLR